MNSCRCLPTHGMSSLSAFLGAEDKAFDIEGATRIGNTIYWISLHSRTSADKARPCAVSTLTLSAYPVRYRMQTGLS